MLLPRYNQIQSGCRVLFLPKNPTNPPVSASAEATNICNSQENLKAVNDERDVGQIPATTYFKGEDMDFISTSGMGGISFSPTTGDGVTSIFCPQYEQNFVSSESSAPHFEHFISLFSFTHLLEE